jgi:hypothetical protein
MVPRAGLEPAQRERRGILNPLCLPISPPGHAILDCDAVNEVPIKRNGLTPSSILHNAISLKFGATHEVRTRDLNLGKVALYQLS